MLVFPQDNFAYLITWNNIILIKDSSGNRELMTKHDFIRKGLIVFAANIFEQIPFTS